MRILHAVALFAVGCLLVAGCTSGAGSTTSTVVSTSASTTTASIPTELQGTWHRGSTTLTLAACAVGEVCGTFERIDDNAEHCVYALVYRSGGATGYNLKTDGGNSFGCAYSGYSHAVVHLMPGSDGTLGFGLQHVPSTAITLDR